MAVVQINAYSQCSVLAEYLDVNEQPYQPIAVEWMLWDLTNQRVVINWTPLVSPQPSFGSDEIPILAQYNGIYTASNVREDRQVNFKVTAPGGAVRYDYANYSVYALPDTPAP